jgi:hypothetical protein
MTGILHPSSVLCAVWPAQAVALKTARPLLSYDMEHDRFEGRVHVIDLQGATHDQLADVVALCPDAPSLDTLRAVRELTVDAAEIAQVLG